jgi:hypothetical protein
MNINPGGVSYSVCHCQQLTPYLGFDQEHILTLEPGKWHLLLLCQLLYFHPKYWTRMEAADSDKCSFLLHSTISYSGKEFYGTGPRKNNEEEPNEEKDRILNEIQISFVIS